MKADREGLAGRVSELSPERRQVLERLLKDQGVNVDRVLIRRRKVSGPAPLSFAQERLWLLDQLEPGTSAYVIASRWRLEGDVDRAALERALNEIVRRHEALRTTFPVVGGVPVQLIASELKVPLEETDLSSLPERQAEVQRLAEEEASRPMDLARGPLVRARVLRTEPKERLLLLTIHHIIFDGWSLGLFLRELTVLYQAFAAGNPSPLAELPVQYADFAQWQREWLQGEVLESQVAYWKKQLAGTLPVLELPTDRPRPAFATFRGGSLSIALPPRLVEAIRALAQREGASVFMVLLAAFQALMHRYTGEIDILVGTPIANRNRSEIEGLIGYFLNNLVLRTDLSGDPRFVELVHRVREAALGAYAHSDLPFEKLLEELRPERDLHHSPLFQVFFNMLSAGDVLPAAPGFLSPAEGGVESAKFDLTLSALEHTHGLTLSLVYSRDLFEPATAAEMLDHLHTLLAAAVVNPDTRLASLPLLSEARAREAAAAAEQARPSSAFTVFTREEADQSIGERFLAAVRLHPGRLAVKTRQHAWTYEDLNAAAERIAAALPRGGEEESPRAALLFGHGAPMIAALVGSLKAGHAYVPLDPSHPRERLLQILEDSGARVLVADRAHRALAERLAGAGMALVDAEAALAGNGATGARSRVSPDGLAYLLYTSGSTGRPKAVMQSHRNVLHHIRNYTNGLHLAAEEGLTLLASYGFDAAVMDIFGALLNGAALHPIDVRLDGLEHLREALHGEEITVYHSTPSLLRALASVLREDEVLEGVRLVVLGGEEAHRQDLEIYRRHFGPRCLLVNGLGPTESTLALQYFVGPESRLTGSAIPVGYPVEGVEVWLLDGEGRRNPVKGEIVLRSAHLALGYWRQPELTRVAFPVDADAGGPRVYLTGDLGRMRPDGALEFIGRKDRQIKLRGIRIDPGEIEWSLTRHPGVREAVVLSLDDRRGDGRLVAYVTLRPPAPSRDELRAFLEARLPGYMVPADFVTLPCLPLTPNGKVDRRALPEPETDAENGEAAHEGPRTALEEVLAVMFAELLDRERVGVHDDFFALGGHSLLATRLASRVRVALEVDLPLRLLFEKRTVSALAAALAADAAPASLEERASALLQVSGMSDEEVDRVLNAPEPPDPGREAV
jgi:amino acid adenylation domain-containing protein